MQLLSPEAVHTFSIRETPPLNKHPLTRLCYTEIMENPMNALSPHQARLLAYFKRLEDGHGNLDAFRAVESDLAALTHLELFELFNVRLQTQQPREILPYVDRIMHAVTPFLKLKSVELPNDSILDVLMKENDALKHRLQAIQNKLQGLPIVPRDYLNDFEALQAFTPHYVKIQNVLFPHLERKDERLTGTKILWSLQDQTKASLKALIAACQTKSIADDDFNQRLGTYFFHAYGLIQKEEVILFQVAMQVFSVEDLELVYDQCLEFPWCFIEVPARLPKVKVNSSRALTSLTGNLDSTQLELVLNALPLDLTFIDEHDKVRFFNKPKDRTFPRSPAVIGRDVRNCHPAESVHVVNAILEAFRNGERDEAKFWLPIKDQFLLIRYLALRDEHGVYQGCLEITQDIAPIQAITGTRRLLDWD
jgi:uncharacterized protein